MPSLRVWRIRLPTANDLVTSILSTPRPLSKDQSKAVISKARYTRIIAGAGAGKTETLTRRISYLLLVEKVKPSAIVAFTFTEKAAQNMKSRIYERVEQVGGAEVSKELGEMYIGTIHGYAKRLLEDYFNFGNRIVLDDNQEVAFIMRHGWTLDIGNYDTNYAASCRTFLKTVNMVWGEMLDRDVLANQAKEFSHKIVKYEEMLNEHKLLTFGTMTSIVVEKLREAPEKVSHIQHLLCDEYQDINKAQEEFIRLLGKNAGIFVVGDPRQSIYQWRGSDERFFEEFSKSFKGTNEISINENRRSTKRIVDNANRFSQDFGGRVYEHLTPVRKEVGAIFISEQEDPEREASWVADQIEVLVKKKKLRYCDVGILTRSVSTSAGPLVDEFKRRHIPYIVGGKVGLFKRDEAQAMGRLFAWLWDDGFWVENPWKWKEQIHGDDLLRTGLALWGTSQSHGTPPNADGELRKIKADVTSGRGNYQNFSQIYVAILNALGFKNLDYNNSGDAAVMANLGRFNNLLTDYETANRLGGRTPKWRTDLKGFCWFMNTHAVQAYDEQPGEDLGGVNAVQLMTIHQAKGLEWPVVFLFATTASRFPPRNIGNPQNWCDIPRDLFPASRYEGSLEDEKRLFYVAITRPKDALVISHFRRKTKKTTRSGFIEKCLLTEFTLLKDEEPLPAIDLKPVEKDPEEMQTFTAGEILTYLRCPHMYLLGAVLGYQPGLHQALGFGNALHHCLRRAGELIKIGGYEPRGAVATAVDQDFHMPFVGGEVFDNYKRTAKNSLLNFTKKHGNDLMRVKEVEYRLEYPIHRATLCGKVDVILDDRGELEARDYKSSEETRSHEEASMQVQLYTLGLRSLGRPVVKGSVAYIQEADVKGVDVDKTTLAKTKEQAEEAVNNIIEQDYEPRPVLGNCGRCDHKSICRWCKE